MAAGDLFDKVFRHLRREFTANTKRALLRDIQGQIDDDEEIQSILISKQYPSRFLAVTFDRRKNDSQFSYSHFDLTLIVIDAISGGKGIYKPSNQMRALRWSSKRRDLLTVLNYFAANNSQLNFQRALILPFPTPMTGVNIDFSVYLK